MKLASGSWTDWLRRFLYTGFFSGYSPKAPGTAGTLLAWLLYCLLYIALGESASTVHLVATLLFVYPAILLGNVAEKDTGEKDPQIVVLDEMIGYWITMLFLPFSLGVSLTGALFFRFFDILKPWPIKGLQKYKGGLGIMIDDYAAGILSNILLHALLFLLKFNGVSLPF